jgi:glucose/arabinose dehydrogenase
METEHLITFLLFHFVTAAALTLGAAVRSGWTRWRIVTGAVALFGVVLITVLGALLSEGSNLLFHTVGLLLSLNRPHSVSALLGVTTAAPLLLYFVAEARRNRESGSTPVPATRWTWLVPAALIGTLLAGSLLVGKEVLSPYLPHTAQQGDGLINREVEPGFALETVAELAQGGVIRVAVSPAGKVYATAQIGIAAQSGALLEVVPNDQAPTGFSTREVASMLNRPFGLLARDDVIYVSRSGQFTRWNNGKPTNYPTGAVTSLRDIDGDGIMDLYHDVVADLPGARSPDYLHQNNAVALGGDGSLYITSGISSDGHPPKHEWEGKILRALPPDYSEVEVFAEGLRNTFGLVIGPDGELFATDNDPQSGNVANGGDKLIHVVAGKNYGHPYADSDHPDVEKEIYRSRFALGGLTYADSPALPAPYRNCLYAVSYGEGKIVRFELERQGDSYTVTRHSFAVVPGAVDVAAAPNGDFYVAAYPDRIVRIRLLAPETES